MQYLFEVILSTSKSINIAYIPCRAKTLNYIIKIYGKISSDLSFRRNIALTCNIFQVQYSITEVSNNICCCRRNLSDIIVIKKITIECRVWGTFKPSLWHVCTIVYTVQNTSALFITCASVYECLKPD